MRVLFAGLLLSSCFGKTIDPVGLPTRAVSNLAECGGGLNLSSRKTLSASIDQATNDGSISLEDERSVSAAFVSELDIGTDRAQVVYNTYVKCITNVELLDANSAALEARTEELISILQDEGASTDRVNEIRSLRNSHLQALNDRDFLGAQERQEEYGKASFEALMSVERMDQQAVRFFYEDGDDETFDTSLAAGKAEQVAARLALAQSYCKRDNPAPICSEFITAYHASRIGTQSGTLQERLGFPIEYGIDLPEE